MQQSAFQAGPLPVSLPVMDAMEPTVATLLGVVAFGEHVAVSPGALTVEVIGVKELGDVVKRVVEDGLTLVEVVPRTESLEDLFVREAIGESPS